MKRFTVITALFSISLLAAWVILQVPAATASSQTKSHNITNKVYYVSDEVLQAIRSGEAVAIPVSAAESRQIAPIFDSTGRLVSDPTGTIWSASEARAMKISPLYDATGALVSDPTGVIWSANHSVDRKIAPVFDSTGAVVSDPTGTLR